MTGGRSGRAAPIVAVALAALAAATAACSSATSSGTVDTTAVAVVHDHAVGTLTRDYVDTARTTAAHGGVPEAPSRELPTLVYYPAVGSGGSAPSAAAEPADAGRPYPLVVLSHGLSGDWEYLDALAKGWAEAGYVVALPRFPLTHAGTEGGVQGGDVQNQPADVSFVIDSVLADSTGPSSDSLLAGLVDPESIAVAGHSNGAITTMGLIANSCCRDPRIDAAVVMSGVDSPFAGGDYDLADTPPVLFVHGVDDQLVSYDGSVAMMNEVHPPKGLLTLEQSDHGTWLSPSSAELPVVVRATVDFLDAELRGDAEALARLTDAGQPPLVTMHWMPDEASVSTVDTVSPPAGDRTVTLSAQDGLRNGQVVTVTWSGFQPGKVVNIVQCAGDGTGGSASCDISLNGLILQPDPTGSGSLDLVIATGPVGDGICDAAHPCTVVVNDAGLQTEDATLRFPITFAP